MSESNSSPNRGQPVPNLVSETSDQVLLRSLIDLAPFYIVRYDINGCILFINDNLAKQLAHPVELYLGKRPNDAFEGQSYDAIEKACKEVVQSELPVVLELEVPLSPDQIILAGGPVTHEIHIIPEKNLEGHVIGTVAFGFDITAIKRYSESLLQRAKLEEQLSGIASSVPGVLYTLIKDPFQQFKFLYASVGIEHLFGMTADSVCKKADLLWSLFNTDDLHQFFNQLQESKPNLPLISRELRMVHPEGGHKWVEVRAMPHAHEDGYTVWHGIMLDITDRKEHETLFAIQSHAMEVIGEAVYLVDERAQILHVNHAACQMVGYTKEELLGMKVTDLAPGFNEESWKLHWREFMALRKITIETEHQTKTGALIPVEVTANSFIHNGRTLNFALVRDIAERKHFEAQMQHRASYDLLTGLPNRRLFNDRLQEEISKAKRAVSHVAIFYIDVDRFKTVNDTLGHHQGDQLLTQTAQRIKECIRDSDTLARVGGDEFVIIMPGVNDFQQLGRVANSIVQAMAMPFMLDKQLSYVSASVGIACYPKDAEHLEGLVSAADQAMYATKELGRNGYGFFTPPMQKEAQQRLLLANDLREAIQKNQLQVFLQPIIEAQTGHVLKAEALLRWEHPVHGMVMPDTFIPIAEETGLIHDIGDWVFRKAMLVLSDWLAIEANENGRYQISVNISPRQFIQHDFGLEWIHYLKTINVSAKNVVIEITESLLLGDDGDVKAKLKLLQDAGIQLALDDFGTGYSAMGYLKKFKIDYLKIDRSFVRDLEMDVNDKAITEAIIVMANKLGLKTIAEGVETKEQKAILAEVGCDYQQGYLYAKPMPAEAFLSFVQATKS